MREKTATFIGHSECPDADAARLYAAIVSLVVERGVTEFLCGGMGQFDWLCAETVYKIKKNYPFVRNTLVIPYLNFNIHKKEIFDDILYPEGFEKYYFKSAIPKRNRYLTDNSAYAVCYIRYGWGRAAKTYERAKKLKLEIINV